MTQKINLLHGKWVEQTLKIQILPGFGARQFHLGVEGEVLFWGRLFLGFSFKMKGAAVFFLP